MDWDFMWRSDIGRDRLLRERLEQQEIDNHTARSRERRRMEGRLQELQGNLEVRLSALSRAFAAYVELDDVREQLSGFPEHSRIRRLALEAVQDFEAGRSVQPIPDLDGYWLPLAVNALRPGGYDPVVAQQAFLRDEVSARLFLVALLGANRHGVHAEQLVIAALRTKDAWDDAQQLLFRAVLDGTYGPGAITALSELVTGHLAQLEIGEWQGWMRQQAAGSAADQLQWLIDRADATGRMEGDASPQRPDDDLRAIAAAELSEGSPGEQELLQRARELREVVRTPNASTAVADKSTVPVVQVVRDTAVAAWSTTRQRHQAWTWIRPYLLPVVDQLGVPEEIRAAQVPVRSGTHEVTVTAHGPEQTELAAARSAITELYTPDGSLMKRAGLLGASLVLGSVLMWLLSVPVLGVLLGLAGLIAAGVAGWSWWQDRAMAQRATQAVERFERDVRNAQQRASELDEQSRESAQQRVALVRRAREVLTAGLTTPVSSSS